MSGEQEKTNEQILKDLIQAFSSLKQKMEDPNYAALDSQMRNMLENQKDMKADVKDLKKRLLNPFDGVIVNTNKNTDFRIEYERLQEERDELESNVLQLIKWKGTYLKVFWALFTAALGIITFLIGESIINAQ
jgi:cell division protein FtsB